MSVRSAQNQGTVPIAVGVLGILVVVTGWLIFKGCRSCSAASSCSRSPGSAIALVPIVHADQHPEPRVAAARILGCWPC